MPQVKTNGISMRYVLEGPAGAPCITFSNSLCCDLGMWDGQAKHFARRYRVLRYDVRGHGGSDASPGAYDFDLLIADVVGLWDALGIEKSHWVGLSMGGMAGFALALAHPDRLGAMVCCDCRAEAPPAYAQFMAERIRITVEQGMQALVEPTINRWFLPQTLAAAPSYVDTVRAMIRATSPAGHIGCCQAIARLAYGERLHAIRVPTLLLGGEADPAAPPEVMRAIARAIPGARHVVIERAGHISNLERPDVFDAAVESFFAGH